MRSGWGKLELPGPPEPTLKIEGLGGWREPGRGRKKALATEPPEIEGENKGEHGKPRAHARKKLCNACKRGKYRKGKWDILFSRR
jgi:hypothetical protein